MLCGCMVYTGHTKMASVSYGTSCASAVSTPLQWTFKKMCYKKLFTHVEESHVSTVSPPESEEQQYINNNNKEHPALPNWWKNQLIQQYTKRKRKTVLTMRISKTRGERLWDSPSQHELEEIHSLHVILWVRWASTDARLHQVGFHCLVNHEMKHSFTDTIVWRCQTLVKSTKTTLLVDAMNTLSIC